MSRWVLVLFFLAASAAAQSPGSAPPAAPPSQETAAEPAGEGDRVSPPLTLDDTDAYRPLGPQIFPFYEHYERRADGTRVRSVLYFLYRSTDNPLSGAWSRLVTPLFFRSVDPALERERFYLFPLSIYSGKDADESFFHILPLYFSSTSPESSFHLVPPLWWRTAREYVTRSHYLFPLATFTNDLSVAENPISRKRIGLWRLLELWESRRTTDTKRMTFLNLFNWSEETMSGISLYQSAWRDAGSQEVGSTYLFPFYWHGRRRDASYLLVPPLFGFLQNPQRVDVHLYPLLSRIGTGTGDQLEIDVLFPLFFMPTNADFSLRTLLFDYSRSQSETSWGILGYLYRDKRNHDTGKHTFSFLFPLSHFAMEPDGIRGTRWFFPYIETTNDVRRWRIVAPLYWDRQTLATQWFFRTFVPTYYSWGTPDDYFSLNFPLYWASHTRSRGWQVFFPLYLHSYNATSRGIHILPVFSYRSFPSRLQLFVAGPTYVFQRYYGLEGEPNGFYHSLLWPLTAIEHKPEGYHYRLLPLFWASRERETTDLLLTPLYYQQDGPDGTHRFFMPIYGRYRTPTIQREFYGGGTFIRTLENDTEGRLLRTRHDYLWGLATIERDHAGDGSHQHVLPAMLWNTHTAPVDRTIVGPLYYSHRVQDGDREHFLDLVLGIIYFSKVVTAPIEEDSTAAAPQPAALPPIPPVREERPERTATGPSTAGTAAERSVHPRRRAASHLYPLNGAAAPAPPPPGKASLQGSLQLASVAPAASATVGQSASSPPGPTAATRPTTAPPGTSAAETIPPRREVSRDTGFLWPLTRKYRFVEDHREGRWILPFYFRTKHDLGDNFGLFPFYYRQKDTGAYDVNYFRYFFLFNRETWRSGSRWSIGQIIFDWFHEENRNQTRWRFLYPIIEHDRTSDGHDFTFTPFFKIESRNEAGRRSFKNRLFPFYWHGRTERLGGMDTWESESSHFFLLPLFGWMHRETRSDYHFLFPLLHLQDTPNSLSFEAWPSLFFRDEPGYIAFRLWPLHTNEHGEAAGDFWVSRYLFLSKLVAKEEETHYRLDPFLLRYSSTPQELSAGALLELFAYHTDGTSTSFRAFPLAFGRASSTDSNWGVIPFAYGAHFGETPIDYYRFWRFFFPYNYLTDGTGERYHAFLWKLLEYSHNPSRPDYHEFRLLHTVYVDRETETSSQFGIQPFFMRYHDDANEETEWQFFFSLYQMKSTPAERTHTLFFFIEF